MTDEQKAAYVIGESACLMAKVFGMHAENMQRQHRGESMAYTEEDFTKAVNESMCYNNATLSLFHGG